jgi:hypothetical protein
MARVRVARFATVVLVGGFAVGVAANCASPTQIIVDVRVDSSLCSSINTGIAVTSPDNVDSAKLSTYQNGCQSTDPDGQSQIGTLTITPSGAKDAEVGIRIVAAVGSSPNPDKCGRTDIDGKADWSNCILARRTARFTSGDTVRITVRLTSDCVGQYCGSDQECNAGVCVRPEQVQDDGGLAPILDATIVGNDANDGPVDSGEDACTRYCVGPNTQCAGNSCVVDCTGQKCDGTTAACGGSFDCMFKCGDNGQCDGVACTTNGTCAFDCTGVGGNHCQNISCRGTSCNVACSNQQVTCDRVYLDAGKNDIDCKPTTALKPTCRNTHCAGGECKRTCGMDGLGCALGDNTTCSGNCDAFEDAGPDAGSGG